MTRTLAEDTQPELKQERLEARVTRQQKAVLAHAAALQGRSLTDFVVSSAQEAALRIIEVYENVSLTRRDREAFVAALLEPPAPGKRLRTAARRYRNATGA